MTSPLYAHPSPLTIATRQSPLALVQAEEVKARLLAAHPGLAVELLPMTTSGDRFTDRPLAEIGGKGLFTKEIEEALLAGKADIAVHSVKDMETKLPPGLTLAATLPREDARDVLIGAASIRALPQGSRIGTASLRRAAQILRLRPDLRIVPLRGNVHTRLRKIEAGEADATLLALAGLKRLGISPLPGVPLSTDEILPAVGQGAIGIECRANDTAALALLATINDAATFAAITAERALLAALDGSCRTPIAAHATVRGDALHLRAMLLSEDGRECWEGEKKGNVKDAAYLGKDVATIIKR